MSTSCIKTNIPKKTGKSTESALHVVMHIESATEHKETSLSIK
jgi:hypothetical protein